jgi:hypothetical protein
VSALADDYPVQVRAVAALAGLEDELPGDDELGDHTLDLALAEPSFPRERRDARVGEPVIVGEVGDRQQDEQRSARLPRGLPDAAYDLDAHDPALGEGRDVVSN